MLNTTGERPALLALYRLHDEMDTFAERIAPVYKALGWMWSNFPEPNWRRVPTADDIKGTLFGLIAAVGKIIRDGEDKADASTGGLSVRVDGGECSIAFECKEVFRPESMTTWRKR